MSGRKSEIRVMIFTRDAYSAVITSVKCNTFQSPILSVHLTAISNYTQEAVIHVVRSPVHSYHCTIAFNTATLTLDVTRAAFRRKILWVDSKDGDVVSSNGDSAHTNYFTLLSTLQEYYRVDVIQSGGSVPAIPYDVCICFVVCNYSCGTILYITGLHPTNSFFIERELRSKYGVKTQMHKRECSVLFNNREIPRVITHGCE